MAVKVKSYAKINLTLDVSGANGGFHALDSFVASVDVYDLITASKRQDKQCFVRFRGLDAEKIPVENNNALKSAKAFVERFQTSGADIIIDRNIPASAGLGGSSADTAGVLNAMKKLYKIDDFSAVKEIADRLGSDTGYMLTGGFCRISGRGEQVEKLPVSGKEKLYLLLLCPKTGVSTAECFQKFDEIGGLGKENATANAIDAFLKKDMDGLGRYLSNDLFPAASVLNQDVRVAFEQLKSFSPVGVNMTGSGSAVYALFETKELRDWAKSRYKGEYFAISAETINPLDKEKSLHFPFALTASEE